MKRSVIFILSIVLIISMFAISVVADTQYTVVKGDSLWKIANRYDIGLREIIEANPHIKNPDLIYPNEKLNIPTPNSAVYNYEQEVIRLVNEVRLKNGLDALEFDRELARVARFKSSDMKYNGYFSHNSPVYGTPFQMMKSFGITFRSAGENIAQGYPTPQSVVNAWMNSSGHRANILNSSFTKIGVGYVADGHYWTQMFISD